MQYKDTLFSHTIKSHPCFIYTSAAQTHGGMEKDLIGIWCYSTPWLCGTFCLFRFGAGPLWIRHVPVHPADAKSQQNITSLNVSIVPQLLCCASKMFLSSCLRTLSWAVLSCLGRPLLLGVSLPCFCSVTYDLGITCGFPIEYHKITVNRTFIFYLRTQRIFFLYFLYMSIFYVTLQQMHLRPIWG